MKHLLRIGRFCDAPVFLEYVDIEKPQGSQPQRYCVRAELQVGEQHRLILTNVFGAQLVRWTMEVPAEVFNTVQIRANRCLSEVAAPQLLKHDLAKMCHREF